MSLRIYLRILVVLGVVSGTAPVRAQIAPELRDRLTHATVYIETQLSLSSRDWAALPPEVANKMGPRPSEPASGSGFLITEDGYVITNAHVINGITLVVQYDGKNLKVDATHESVRPIAFNPERPGEPFTLQFNATSLKVVVDSGLETEKSFSPSVVRMDREIDLALLKISQPEEFTFVPLAPEEEVQAGTPAVMAGFPGGGSVDTIPFMTRENAGSLSNRNPRVSLNTGAISSVRVYGKEKRYQLAISANHGNSGGPITGKEGGVIAVLYAGIDQMQNINYAIPSAYVARVCPSDLKEELGLASGEPGGAGDEESEEGGDQSFDEFLGEGNFDFGDAKKKK